MKVLKNWMVAMDFSEHDEILIDYTYHLAQAFVPEEIIFIHITPRIEIPIEFFEGGPLDEEGASRSAGRKGIWQVFGSRFRKV